MSKLCMGDDGDMKDLVWGVEGESTERDYWKEGAFGGQVKTWSPYFFQRLILFLLM